MTGESAGSTIEDRPHLLNFGCGSALHPEWINLDSSAAAPDVVAHDLHHGLPFPSNSFDAAYGSHVLEHLEPDAASRLLRECHRILRPGGILRIVVPDLETIARLYLDSLERATTGDIEAAFRYDWMMLELYDQVVRTRSGGNMATYLAEDRDRISSRFIAERIGCEGAQATAYRVSGYSKASRVMRKLQSMADSIRRMAVIACGFVFLGSRGAAAVREGLFRDGGEVHRWMYDRFSLARTLREVGFASIQRRFAGESDIPGFARFELEIVNGRERKPDSLYMEGRKPAGA